MERSKTEEQSVDVVGQALGLRRAHGSASSVRRDRPLRAHSGPRGPVQAVGLPHLPKPLRRAQPPDGLRYEEVSAYAAFSSRAFRFQLTAVTLSMFSQQMLATVVGWDL